MTDVIVKREKVAVPSDTRRKMIEGAVTLLAMRGLEGTAFSDVLERSGAPRGSIYHHFPGGKAQLGVEAVESSGRFINGLIEQGVEGVVILDGKVEHAVLMELLTDGGAGTLMHQ